MVNGLALNYGSNTLGLQGGRPTPPVTASFFVDYDSGSDSSAGTATGTAWKHCPGDPNATNTPLATTLGPGDIVSFRGGVRYRGDLVIDGVGTEVSPITFRGNGWGASAAIMEGSEVFSPTWTQCTGPGDCAGNPDWADIWYTTAPVGFDYWQPIYEDDEFLWFSQFPNPADPLYYDRYQDFKTIQVADVTREITRTSITDPDVFSQVDADFWDEAYVLVRRIPDVVTTTLITSFDPDTDTVYFDDIGGDLYGDENDYSVMNHASLIDTPGEFAFSDNTIYFWPRNSDNPNVFHDYSISERKIATDLSRCEHVVYEGFTIRGYHALQNDVHVGLAFFSNYSETNNITIQDNEITKIRSPRKSGIFQISDAGYKFRILNNHVHECMGNRGAVFSSVDDVWFDNNIIEDVGGTGVFFQGATNSRMTWNIVRGIEGSHSNGISVYSFSENILIAHNQLVCGATNIPFTLNQTENIWIICNVIDGIEESSAFTAWNEVGFLTGQNYMLNNSCMRAGPYDKGIIFGSGGSANVMCRNNIVDGGLMDDREYTMYNGFYVFQGGGWTPGTGEFFDYDDDLNFADYVNGDHNLITGSAAIGQGIDVSAYYPTALWPDYDFTVDLNGVTRTSVGGWDLGAYEYVAP